MKLPCRFRSCNSMYARDLRYRFPNQLTYRQAIRIVAQVQARLYHNFLYSCVYQRAMDVHNAAYALLTTFREMNDIASELRYCGVVNSLYWEAEQLLGNRIEMENFKAKSLLKKEAWHNEH